jgi:hypothetical protein
MGLAHQSIQNLNPACQLSILDHPYHFPESSRARLSAPTIVETLHLFPADESNTTQHLAALGGFSARLVWCYQCESRPMQTENRPQV